MIDLKLPTFLFLFCFIDFAQGQCKGVSWKFYSVDWQRSRFYGGYEQRIVAQHWPITDATRGNEDCATEMPLACVSPDSPVGTIPSSYFYSLIAARQGGSVSTYDPGGRNAGTLTRQIKLTTINIAGHCFTSIAAMNQYCVNEFGPGYTSAHHHAARLEVSGGQWGLRAYYEPSQAPPESARIWSYTEDQTGANPWSNNRADISLCTTSPSNWTQQIDECVTYGKPACPDWQPCNDRDPRRPGGIVCGSCTDGIRNPDEWGIDCGGKCADKPCSSDCAVSCAIDCPPCPATCRDGQQNGQETGVDCGGPACPACIESCWDGILNSLETGIDCGGPLCVPCEGFANFSINAMPAPHTCFDLQRADTAVHCPHTDTFATCYMNCTVSSSTLAPTPRPPTVPTSAPTTPFPTPSPTTPAPTTPFPTASPTPSPTTPFPTPSPTTPAPTTAFPTSSPTPSPTTAFPTSLPTSSPTTAFPTTAAAGTVSPTITLAPTSAPVEMAPTAALPTPGLVAQRNEEPATFVQTTEFIALMAGLGGGCLGLLVLFLVCRALTGKRRKRKADGSGNGATIEMTEDSDLTAHYDTHELDHVQPSTFTDTEMDARPQGNNQHYTVSTVTTDNTEYDVIPVITEPPRSSSGRSRSRSRSGSRSGRSRSASRSSRSRTGSRSTVTAGTSTFATATKMDQAINF